MAAKKLKISGGTDIERLIGRELIRRKIPFTFQKPLLGITIVDFFLRNFKRSGIDVCLYCDGDYWHSLPEQKRRDKKINRKLLENCYCVVRIPGSLIMDMGEKYCIDDFMKWFNRRFRK